MLKLVCYVRGDKVREVFVVKIKENEVVATLKEVVKEGKKPVFDDIAADSLTIWSKGITLNEHLKDEVDGLKLVKNDALNPLETLSDIFASGLQKGVTHIIIDRPPGECSGYSSISHFAVAVNYHL